MHTLPEDDQPTWMGEAPEEAAAELRAETLNIQSYNTLSDITAKLMAVTGIKRGKDDPTTTKKKIKASETTE